MLKDRMFTLKVLSIVSVLMFFSLFTMMPKVIGTVIVIWVVVVFWNLKLMMDSANLTLADFENAISQKIDEADVHKKYFQKSFYYMVLPMMGIGIAMVVIIIIAFFTFL